MGRQENVDNAIWHDPDFEDLSLEAQHLYLWSFTNPRCGMAGIYKVSRRAMGECKVPEDRLDDALTELAAGDFLHYQEQVLWVRSRVKRLQTKTGQVAKSIAKDLRHLRADHPLVVRFVETYSVLPWLREFLTLDRPSFEGQKNGSSKPEGRPSPEGHPTLRGRGRSQGQKEEPLRTEESKRLSGEFEDWLADFHDVTGREQVRGSKEARKSFAARRREGWSVDDLKLATLGCHNDDWKRERDFDVPETILAGNHIERYIEAGRKATRNDRSAYDAVVVRS